MQCGKSYDETYRMPCEYTERVLNLKLGSDMGKKYLRKSISKVMTLMLRSSGAIYVRLEERR